MVQKKLVKAAEPEMELLGVARQARDQAAAIELFVERAEHDQLSAGQSRIGFDLAAGRQTAL